MADKETILSAKRSETLTQAYHAGVIISRIENYLPHETIPTIAVCMVHFHSLREVLGENLWQRLKSKKIFANRIKVYEALNYQPLLPKEMIGTYREFCLGYARSYENSKLKYNTDKERLQTNKVVIDHLFKELNLVQET